MDFVLLINKEKDFTSRDVVNKLNKILNTRKIGHTGTLDPIATGVLVVCVGKYTKLVNLLTSLDKEYIAMIKLGIKTDTGDITGNVIEKKEFNLTKDQIINVLNSFLGESIQEVPAFSAVKVNGKKLYEYARNNEKVELPKRKIIVYNIELIDFHDDLITFKTKVSKGTYIRSLIDDICTKLNTVGTMESLTRTKQGKFMIEDSFTIENVAQGDFKKLSLTDLVDYPVKELTDEEYFKVKNGGFIHTELDSKYVILAYKEKEIAIYEINENLARPNIMLI